MDLLPIRPGMKYWSNWVEIHWDYLYACLYIVWLYGLVEFDGLNLNGFTPNLTRRISNLTRHKFLVKLGVNCVNSLR